MLPATWPLVTLPSAPPKVGAVIGWKNSSELTSRLMVGNSSRPLLSILAPMVALRVWSSAPASAVTSTVSVDPPTSSDTSTVMAVAVSTS